MACDYETEYKCGDGEHNLLKKILGRLKQLVGLADPPGGGSTVTLTVSDIEIGAVEIKDGDTDTRAMIITACPGPADRGLVVRNIPCGTQVISAGSLPLPTGAATEATLLDWLPSIYGAVIDTNFLLNTRLTQGQNLMEFSLSVTMASDQPAILVTGPLTEATFSSLIRTTCPSGADSALAVRNIPCGTQPISAASLPLPTGAATEATLSGIAVNIDLPLSALNGSVNGVSNALQDPDFGLPAIINRLPVALVGGRLDTNIGAWLGSTAPTVGQKNMTGSIPVVIAADQPPILSTLVGAAFIGVCPGEFDQGLVVRNIPCGTQVVSGPFLTDAQLRATAVAISAASLPLPAGAATEANLSAVRDFLANLDAFVSTFLPGILTEATFGSLIRTTCPSGADSALAVRNIPCGTQAVSGPLTDAQLRAAAVPVSGITSTKTALTASSPTAVSVGVTSAQAVAAAATRKGLVLINTSSSTISLGFGATAVLGSGITLLPGDSFSMDEYSFYTGVINAIALGVGSNLAIQEFTT